MSDINVVVLGGRLTAKPELRYTPSSKPVCNLRLASNNKRKDTEETLYITVEVWDKAAEACAAHLDKGSAVTVTGKLVLKQWETKTGEKRERMDMVASQVVFGAKGSSKSQAGGDDAPPADDDIPF